MEKDTNIIFRVNSKLKNSATNVAKKYGVSLTELITACLVEFDKRDFVPLNIRRHFPNKDIDNSQLTLMLIKMQLKDIINKYAKGKVNKVYLFGSYARGDQTYKSDVDLRFEINADFSLFDHSNIHMDLEEALHKHVDIITEDVKNLDEFFANNIRKDEICIYEYQG